MASSNLWTLNIQESASTFKVPELPVDQKDILAVSCGQACISLVTKDGGVRTAKVKAGEVKEWKKPPGLTQHDVCKVQSGTVHHVAMTKQNNLLAWGQNSLGQLGRGRSKDTENGKKMFSNASLISHLKNVRVLQVSCGNAHTVCVSEEGHVYSWGANDCGQLGRDGRNGALDVPQIIEHLKNIPMVQVSAGGKHSVALSISGLVFCWGSNRFGQLNLKSGENHTFPESCSALSDRKIQSICCGENHTAFLTRDGCVFTCGLESTDQLNHIRLDHPSQLREMTGCVSPVSQIACGGNNTFAYSPSSNTVHIFGCGKSMAACLPNEDQHWKTSLMCGNESLFVFQSSSQETEEVLDHQYFSLDFLQDVMRNQVGSDDEIRKKVERVFGNASCINRSFLSNEGGNAECTESNHGVDLDKANVFFEEIRKSPYRNIAEKTLERLLKKLSPSTSFGIESLRVYLILPCCLYADLKVYNTDIVTALANLLLGLDERYGVVLENWVKGLPSKYFKKWIWFFKMAVMKSLNRQSVGHKIPMISEEETDIVKPCVLMLEKLNEINLCRSTPIKIEKFYLHELLDKVDVQKDYRLSLEDDTTSSVFRFCKFPSLYNSGSKFLLLRCQCENIMKFYSPDISTAATREIHELIVRRTHLIEDTKPILSKGETVLRQRFFINFKDETKDSGDGVRQEYFQILFEKLLDPNFGAFDTESGIHWFSKDADPEDVYFTGLMCGLALYNHVILDLQFPLTLYQQLVKKDDEKDSFLLHAREEKQIESFRKGFYKGVPKNLLSSFHPQELKDALTGVELHDFEAFENATEYVWGYTRCHQTIQFFWEVFHSMELNDKKGFIKFLTSVDRIPANGLKMTINYVTEENPNGMLPTAVTCEQRLLLPPYTTKEILEERILDSARYCTTGFSCPY